jgi:hypothetical protein
MIPFLFLSVPQLFPSLPVQFQSTTAARTDVNARLIFISVLFYRELGIPRLSNEIQTQNHAYYRLHSHPQEKDPSVAQNHL